MELEYFTRDAKGNDFVKKVAVKKVPVENIDFVCPICKGEKHEGCKVKKIVSSKFTDWAFVGDYVCSECSRLFSLYPYSYVVDPEGIKLLNIRQLRNALCKNQKTPFRFCISTTQKKHLFYRSVLNYNNEQFAVNLETETIYTTHERMKFLFSLIESLITLGASKKALASGEMPFQVTQKTGFDLGFAAIVALIDELKNSQEIQIPLFCGQKLSISEEKAVCNLDLLLRTRQEQKQL